MREERSLFRVWVTALVIGTLAIGVGLALEMSDVELRTAAADPGMPALGDDDGDGIPNIADNSFNRMSATDPDRDRDGFPDGFEVATESNPNDALSIPSDTAGTQVLVAPDGPQVYIVLVSASIDRFVNVTNSRVIVVKHGPSRNSVAVVNIDAAFIRTAHELKSTDGTVRSLTIKVPRRAIGRWTIGYGMRDGGAVLCDDLFVNHRQNGLIYTINFGDEAQQRTSLEPTESETPTAGNGFKECVQLSYGAAGGSIRHVVSEKCETRDLYLCASDCGILVGATIVRLKQQWLY